MKRYVPNAFEVHASPSNNNILFFNRDRSLTIHIGSNQLLSCHRHSITSISEDKTHLFLKGRHTQ